MRITCGSLLREAPFFLLSWEREGRVAVRERISGIRRERISDHFVSEGASFVLLGT